VQGLEGKFTGNFSKKCEQRYLWRHIMRPMARIWEICEHRGTMGGVVLKRENDRAHAAKLHRRMGRLTNKWRRLFRNVDQRRLKMLKFTRFNLNQAEL